MVSRHFLADSGDITQLVLDTKESRSSHMGSLDLVAGVPGGGDMMVVWDHVGGLGGIMEWENGR